MFLDQAFKFQIAQDNAIKDLAGELKETLIHARSCRDLRTMPNAMNPVQELARLTAECASLLDESMKHALLGKSINKLRYVEILNRGFTFAARTAKTAASKTLHHRITDCNGRLKKLRKNLQMVLLINIHEKGMSVYLL